MADTWAAFPDAPVGNADPWARFPDVEPVRPATKPLSPGKGEAIDGDTLRLGDNRLRLWGYDAPELAQQGWNQQGEAVPIGQRSRGALVNLMASSSLTPGQSVGSSYGRTVAPVTIHNQDLAQQLLREGQGFAAPQFLASDPKRRFDYLQAERLARLNGLGLHDYYVRPPAEHRAAPRYVPTRETVAQWFDTPTPIAGMSADAEQRYLELLNTATTPDEVVAFVESHAGFKLDRKEVANFIRARDAAKAQHEALTQAAIGKALEGDVTALRLCLDRIAPPRKDAPVKFDLGPVRSAEDAVIASSALLESVAAGELTPDEAGRLMALLTAHRQMVETGDLESRVAVLEARK